MSYKIIFKGIKNSKNKISINEIEKLRFKNIKQAKEITNYNNSYKWEIKDEKQRDKKQRSVLK